MEIPFLVGFGALVLWGAVLSSASYYLGRGSSGGGGGGAGGGF